MTVLRRRIPTGGHSRIPVRVEDAKTGQPMALTVAASDGFYEVQVPGGRYRVSERRGRSFSIVVPDSGGPFDIGSLAGEDPTTDVVTDETSTDPPAMTRQLEATSAAHTESRAQRGRLARVPRDGSRERTDGSRIRAHRSDGSLDDGDCGSAEIREL